MVYSYIVEKAIRQSFDDVNHHRWDNAVKGLSPDTYHRDWLRQTKVQAVIPSSAARRAPYPLDRRAYRRRNVIERLFCKLKNWRRIATRYDRLAQNYLSAIALVSIVAAWI